MRASLSDTMKSSASQGLLRKRGASSPRHGWTGVRRRRCRARRGPTGRRARRAGDAGWAGPWRRRAGVRPRRGRPGRGRHGRATTPTASPAPSPRRAGPATRGSPPGQGRDRSARASARRARSSGRADPLVGAVGEQLVLPDRHLVLEPCRSAPARPRTPRRGGRPWSRRPPRCRRSRAGRRGGRPPRRATSYSCGDAVGRPRASALERGRVGGVVEARRRRGRGRGRGRGRRRGSARRPPRRRAAASTSATSSGVSRRSHEPHDRRRVGGLGAVGHEPTLGHRTAPRGGSSALSERPGSATGDGVPWRP